MNIEKYISTLSHHECVAIRLACLFDEKGYMRQTVPSFEEYSFYSDNRTFLSGDGVITFNNAQGKLMSLRPDVTLSLVKRAALSDSQLTRISYNENVYRIREDSGDFDEIHQSGVELLGKIDQNATLEVLTLALESLALLDGDFRLNISHLAWLDSFIKSHSLSGEALGSVVTCIKNKNMHQLHKLCRDNGLSEKDTHLFNSLFALEGSLSDVLPTLKEFILDDSTAATYEELNALHELLSASPHADKISFDFSVVNHLDYYNGLVFRGYIKNSPYAVLSGGQYDNLVKKLRQTDLGAIGFAVYLDNIGGQK